MLRFPTYSYGLLKDIENSFLHVGIDECDRDLTRFLWLAYPSDPKSIFQVYRLKVV